MKDSNFFFAMDLKINIFCFHDFNTECDIFFHFGHTSCATVSLIKQKKRLYQQQ